MKGAMDLRRAVLGDLATLAALHAQCFAEGWSGASFAQLLATPGAFAFLAVADGTPQGFVLARATAGEAEILSLGVLPGMRRGGYGAALVRAAAVCAGEAGARRLFLEVGAGNEAARHLYRRLGFGEVGRRPRYYRRESGGFEDALILARDLPL